MPGPQGGRWYFTAREEGWTGPGRTGSPEPHPVENKTPTPDPGEARKGPSAKPGWGRPRWRVPALPAASECGRAPGSSPQAVNTTRSMMAQDKSSCHLGLKSLGLKSQTEGMNHSMGQTKCRVPAPDPQGSAGIGTLPHWPPCPYGPNASYSSHHGPCAGPCTRQGPAHLSAFAYAIPWAWNAVP